MDEVTTERLARAFLKRFGKASLRKLLEELEEVSEASLRKVLEEVQK